MIAFLHKKGVTLSPRDYFVTALSSMALGVFSTLIIGLIVRTIGQQLQIEHLVVMGDGAMAMMGAGIGVAVAYGLKAPPLVLFASVFTGTIGATLGGPAGSYFAALVATEFGKTVSRETKVDIIVTPLVTIIIGYVVAILVGIPLEAALTNFGNLIMLLAEQRPIIMGTFISALMGLALTAPISSAAIAIMLNLQGLAAGAATIGCSAQMIGFAVISYRENKMQGVIAQGIGTSMLQVPNIVRNPRILIPPTLAGAILGPIGTTVFSMTNEAAGAGMGTSGFVGQIMTFTSMGFTTDVVLKVVLLHIIAPAIISLVLSEWMRKIGWIREGDMKLPLEG